MEHFQEPSPVTSPALGYSDSNTSESTLKFKPGFEQSAIHATMPMNSPFSTHGDLASTESWLASATTIPDFDSTSPVAADFGTQELGQVSSVPPTPVSFYPSPPVLPVNQGHFRSSSLDTPVRDFRCCGINYPSLSEYLSHYESNHISQEDSYSSELQKPFNPLLDNSALFRNMSPFSPSYSPYPDSPIASRCNTPVNTNLDLPFAFNDQFSSFRIETTTPLENIFAPNESQGRLENTISLMPAPTAKRSRGPSFAQPDHLDMKKFKDADGFAPSFETLPEWTQQEGMPSFAPFVEMPSPHPSFMSSPHFFMMPDLPSPLRPASTPAHMPSSLDLFDPSQAYEQQPTPSMKRQPRLSHNHRFSSSASGPITIEPLSDGRYRCPNQYCSKIYKNPNGLKYHLRHGNCEFDATPVHSADNTASIDAAPSDIKISHRPFICRECGKKYKNLNGLKYHARAEHPTKDFDQDIKSQIMNKAQIEQQQQLISESLKARGSA